MRDVPTLDHEQALWQAGYRSVAGVDEAGRGPLAGPVVAAAVALPVNASLPWLAQVRDSKQLTPRQRAVLAERIQAEALAVGVGILESEAIDAVGIRVASLQAMGLALARLRPAPDFALVDGRDRLDLELPHTPVVRGDARCVSVAAASIVAKVTRDRIMEDLDGRYPDWGFARHKGYPTAEHLALLATRGPTPVHRRSFLPVREALRRLLTTERTESTER
ncbi:MAG: ribonuclease HII [Chloroflexi bacterium]|nr:ribonuclease HII [Chloroflexota bacterium]